MDTTTRTGSPLRQRMIEDMRMRKLEPRTQEAYIRAVRKLTVFLERSPDTATVEDLRNFQLHLVDAGTSPVTLNATLTGLKFFFDITLGRGELMARMQPVKLPRTVPVVLSMKEAAALIAAARNIKHQAALSVAYGAGLRASEVCRPKVGDVDSQRMALRVEQGKGAKDRYAMLSPVVLQRLAATLMSIGSPSYPALRALQDCCSLWDSWGRQNIEDYIVGLAQYLRYRLVSVWGPRCLASPYDADTPSFSRVALTSFNPFSPGFDYNAVLTPAQATAQTAASNSAVTVLREQFGIVVRNTAVPHTLRGSPALNAASNAASHPLRISTHLFHRREDVDKLVDALLQVVPRS